MKKFGTKKPVLLICCAMASLSILLAAMNDPGIEAPDAGKPAVNPPYDPVPRELDYCIREIKEAAISGRSMSGLLENGETIEILTGYYECNPVRRGDVVHYMLWGEKSYVKIIKAIPGDHIALKKDGGLWRILVNGKTAKNSAGIPYGFNSRSERILRLDVGKSGTTLSHDSYLLLGNLPGGTHDSSHYGLVTGRRIMGKIRRKK